MRQRTTRGVGVAKATVFVDRTHFLRSMYCCNVFSSRNNRRGSVEVEGSFAKKSQLQRRGPFSGLVCAVVKRRTSHVAASSSWAVMRFNFPAVDAAAACLSPHARSAAPPPVMLYYSTLAQ